MANDTQSLSSANSVDPVAGAAAARPDAPPILSVRAQRLLSTALLAVVFAVNAWLTWLRLGNIAIDCAREMDIARQLNESRILYRDLRYFYGPLAPWVNAALFRMLGTHSTSLRIGGLLCAAAACVLLYRLSRLFVSRAAATAIVVLFQFVSVFAHLTLNGVFNFILPYTQAATYGITVAVASLFFLIRYAKKERSADFCWSIAFLTLASFSKLEIFVATAGTHAAFFAARLFVRRLNYTLVLAGYAVFSGIFVTVYALIVNQVGTHSFFGDNIAAPLNDPNYRQFAAQVLGLDNLPQSLCNLGYATLALSGAAALIYAAQRLSAHARWRVPAYALGIGAFLIYYLTSAEYAFTAVPFLSLACLAVLLITAIRHPKQRNALIPEALLWTFALALSSRILFKCVSYQFGFYLLTPSFVGLGLVLFRKIPGKRPAAAAVFTGACALLGISANHFQSSMAIVSKRTYEISTPYGREFEFTRMFGIPEGACYAEAIRLLATLNPYTPVVVLPQGVGLMYYAGLENQYGASALERGEVSGDYDDDHVLARFKANPPRVIVWLKTGASESHFGTEYLVKTHAWFTTLYEPCLSLGPDDFILFYKLKDAPFPFPSVPLERRNIKPAH